MRRGMILPRSVTKYFKVAWSLKSTLAFFSAQNRQTFLRPKPPRPPRLSSSIPPPRSSRPPPRSSRPPPSRPPPRSPKAGRPPPPPPDGPLRAPPLPCPMPFISGLLLGRLFQLRRHHVLALGGEDGARLADAVRRLGL